MEYVYDDLHRLAQVTRDDDTVITYQYDALGNRTRRTVTTSLGLDTDGDGVPDSIDSAPNDRFVCRDVDGDTCDDCSSGTYNPANDGTDTDADGFCNLGDPDDDNDGVPDPSDSAPTNQFLCRDIDADTCDDCSSGFSSPANDGLDTDVDGLCNAGDPDDDADGAADDGDLSGVPGDNPCTAGNTLDCDDNCPLLANANQADADGDGFGDACDPTLGLVIEWVTVGDPNNAPDTEVMSDSTTGYGSVGYVYEIGKFEVTNSQYVELLNAVAASDPNGLYNDNMALQPFAGITRNGSAGSYTYDLKPGMADAPVNYVSFYDSLRFANWLHNGQPTGAQDASTTEDGAYDMSQGAGVSRKPDATVFLSSEGEWYKAAYYDTVSRIYFDYPTESNIENICEVPPGGSTSGNCWPAVQTVTNVGAYTQAVSPNGTFDQGGNVVEWNESLVDSFRGSRGGSWQSGPPDAGAWQRYHNWPTLETRTIGFRVARIGVAGADSDGDGVPDNGDRSEISGDSPCTGGDTFGCDDNCPLIANPSQADSDGDRIGDACETNQAQQVVAGDSHTCALTTVGGVHCWGYNGSGQLGNGTTTDSTVPVPVTGLSSGVAAIAAGDSYTCALTTTGGALCWGANGPGQLGNGTTTGSTVPVPVTGLSSGVAAIAAGDSHTCALTTTGGALCWGANGPGQLGNGTTTGSTVPVPVTGLSSGVAAIAAGDSHTCALTTTGSALCWGSNGDGAGQLGNGTTTDSTVPVPITGLSSGVVAISAGAVHTCAVTTTGGALCWGYNEFGALGDGTYNCCDGPVSVTGLSSGVAAISAGLVHTCAVTTVGGILCWGDNWYGELGNETVPETESRVPIPVPGFGAPPPSACGVDGAPCDDGVFCNGPDTCSGGLCGLHAGSPCPAMASDCSDWCDELTDSCSAPEPDGSTCNDALVCGEPDFCSGGVCAAGPAIDCGDGNSCTADFCDDVTGCANAPIPGCLLFSYAESFESLPLGDISLEPDWSIDMNGSAGTAEVVAGGGADEGLKYLRIATEVGNNKTAEAWSTFSDEVLAGEFYLSVRVNSTGVPRWIYLSRAGNPEETVNIILWMGFDGAGHFILGNASVAYGTYVPGQWYRLGFRYELTDSGFEGLNEGTWQLNIDGGSWSPPQSMTFFGPGYVPSQLFFSVLSDGGMVHTLDVDSIAATPPPPPIPVGGPWAMAILVVVLASVPGVVATARALRRKGEGL